MADHFEASCLSGLKRIRHGFFTRRGGVSDGIYASLNTGLGSNDRRECVLENRARVAATLGATRSEVVTVHQVHSAEAVVVSAPFQDRSPPRADAIVTTTPGLVIGALAADCAPVLFADEQAGVVAAAHAGWRGALGGIIEATLAAMIGAGASRAHITAAVGPCINLEAYEVGPEFKAAFLAADPASSNYFMTPPGNDRPHFDLSGYTHHRLKSAGITTSETVSPCTFANESDFFSFRRSVRLCEADYGRHISAIVLGER